MNSFHFRNKIVSIGFVLDNGIVQSGEFEAIKIRSGTIVVTHPDAAVLMVDAHGFGILDAADGVGAQQGFRIAGEREEFPRLGVDDPEPVRERIVAEVGDFRDGGEDVAEAFLSHDLAGLEIAAEQV